MDGWLEWYLNDRPMKMNESRAGSPSSPLGKNATHTGGLQKTKACNSLVLVWYGIRSSFAMSGD